MAKNSAKSKAKANKAAAKVIETVTPVVDEIKEAVAPVVDEIKEAVAPVVDEIKEAVAPVVEEVKETVAPVVEEVKAAKADKKDKKALKTEEKAETSIFVEYHGEQRKVEEIVDRIKDEWVSQGHRLSSIKTLNVYLKPEEFTAYYVINDKVSGKVWM